MKLGRTYKLRIVFFVLVAFPLIFFLVSWPKMRLTLITKALRQAAKEELGYRFSYEKAHLYYSGEVVYEGVELKPLTAASFGTLTIDRLAIYPSISLTTRSLKAAAIGEGAHLTLAKEAYRFKPVQNKKRELLRSSFTLFIQGFEGTTPFEAALLPSGEGYLSLSDSFTLTTRGDLIAEEAPLKLFFSEMEEGVLEGVLEKGKGALSLKGGAFGPLQALEGTLIFTPFLTLDAKASVPWGQAKLTMTPQRGFDLTVEGIGAIHVTKEKERYFGTFDFENETFSLKGELLAKQEDGGWSVALKSPRARFSEAHGEVKAQGFLSERFEFKSLSGEVIHGALATGGHFSARFLLDGDRLLFPEIAGEKGSFYFASQGQFFLKEKKLQLFDFSFAKGSLKDLPFLAAFPGELRELYAGSLLELSEEGAGGVLLGEIKLPKLWKFEDLTYLFEYDLDSDALVLSDLTGSLGHLALKGDTFLTLEKGVGTFDCWLGEGGEEAIHLFGNAKMKAGALELSVERGAHLGSFFIDEGDLQLFPERVEGSLKGRGDLFALSRDMRLFGKFPWKIPPMEGKLALQAAFFGDKLEIEAKVEQPKVASFSAPLATLKGSFSNERLLLEEASMGDFHLALSIDEQGDQLVLKGMDFSYGSLFHMHLEGKFDPGKALFDGEVTAFRFTPTADQLHFIGEKGLVRVDLGAKEPFCFSVPLACGTSTFQLLGKGTELKLQGEKGVIRYDWKKREGTLNVLGMSGLIGAQEAFTLTDIRFETSTLFSGLNRVEVSPSGEFSLVFDVKQPLFTPFGFGTLRGHLTEKGALFDRAEALRDGFYLSSVTLGDEPSFVAFSGEVELRLQLETAGMKTKMGIGGTVWQPEISSSKR